MSGTAAQDQTVSRPPASGLRVVEIGESRSAALAGMVLADFGAEVIVVEPPGGSRLRALPAWRMWARGKRSVVLDLAEVADRRRAGDLASGADVVLSALRPATADRLGVDAATLRAAAPGLVHCEITGFGRGHPLSSVAGYEGIVAARAGRAYEFSVLTDGRRPVYPAVGVAGYAAAMLALQGVFSALVQRERSGEGQAVAVSLLGALSVYDLSGWAPGGSRQLRLADTPLLFYTVARTRDGVWLQFSQNSPRLFRSFLRALGLEHVLEEDRYRHAPSVADPADGRALRALLLDRVAERSWSEWQEVFATEPNVSAEPMLPPGAALHHPQLLHTGDSAAAGPATGLQRWLGPLVSCSATPARPPAPSPPLGRRGEDIAWAAPGGPAARGESRPRSGDGRPLLSGITVVEMATWIATPVGTSLLGELGARVIKVEAPEGDPIRSHGPACFKFVQGKESITVDLKRPEGREIVQRLIGRADVLAHNYRPGVPERLGIDYPTLRSLNPGLIYLYAGSYGSSGPMSQRPAFHVTAGAVCGGVLAQAGTAGVPGPEARLTDDEVVHWSRFLSRCNESNPDFNAGLAVAVAVTMALYHRARTGEGQAIETRMLLSNAYTLSEFYAEEPGSDPASPPGPGRLADPGLHGLHALYRLYEAADGWVFLAAASDEEFLRLCRALQRPDLAEDPVLSDATGRLAHDAELTDALSRVFATRGSLQWQQALTAAGVACVQANDGPASAYLCESPWSDALGFTERSTAGGRGPYRRYGRVVRTAADLGPLGSADEAGSATRPLLAELGYDAEALDRLLDAGVVQEPGDAEPVTVERW